MKRMYLVQAVAVEAEQTNVPQLLTISQEVELCSNYLCQLQDKVDLSKSSRWFREMGSMGDRKKLIAKGFIAYQQSANAINSVTVANYIKALLRDIPGGLIPSATQKLLIEILRDKNSIIAINQAIDKQDQMAVRAILGLVPARHEMIKNILRLCDLIFKMGTIDPIEPEALARIITVTSQDWLGSMDMNDPVKIQQMLKEWQSVWGKVISNEQLFF